MDMGEFIAEVRKRECLWNKKKIPFTEHQQKICDQLWREVATACNISLKTAKLKWRSLRDNFYRHLKKVPVYSSGDSYYIEESEKPCWPHFNNLLFLLATIKPENKVININDESIIDISSLADFDSSNIFSNIANETLLSTTPPPAENYDKKTNTVEQGHDLNNTNLSVGNIKKEDEVLDKLTYHAAFVSAPPPEEVVRIPCADNRTPYLSGPPPLVMIQPQKNNSALIGTKRVYTLEKTDDLDSRHEQCSASPSKKAAYESDVNPSLLKLADEPVDDNENLAFFRSMIPFMNKFNAVKQLQLRLKLQEIILEEFVS